MSLFRFISFIIFITLLSILFSRFGNSLSDHQFRNINFILKQISHSILNVFYSFSFVSLSEDCFEYILKDLSDKKTVVSSYCFDTLLIDFIVSVRFSVVNSSISFLCDQKIREINFFKLKFDRFDKNFRDFLCCLSTKLHCFFNEFFFTESFC